VKSNLRFVVPMSLELLLHIIVFSNLTFCLRNNSDFAALPDPDSAAFVDPDTGAIK
jgi:hypothetical protein